MTLIAGCSFTAPPESEPARVLVLTRTAGFRHDSIPAGIDAVRALGRQHGFEVEQTEDAAAFTAGHLTRFAAVVFLNTTGDVLDDQQQAAFEAYVRAGGGFVGVHAAADTEHDWEWYGRLVGARFAGHPPVQKATIDVVDRAHESTSMLPTRWERTDEWYNYAAPPATGIRVLMRLDEATYTGGTMGPRHAIAWCHEFDGGRAWYTGGGHTIESFAEPLFRDHLLGGIVWAARLRAVAPSPSSP